MTIVNLNLKKINGGGLFSDIGTIRPCVDILC